MGILFIVATPIGNLEDTTQRALRVLSEVDLILCEDTRVTKVLLDRYQIKTALLSYHQHSKFERIDYILGLLRQGKNLALVSDAGTPGISDPGNKLVESVIDELAEEVRIVPVPGASAVLAGACISGFPTDRFLFLGFPPLKKRRKQFFKEVVASPNTVIFYESPYRILKTLNDLKLAADVSKASPKVVACRELTKKFETICRGKLQEVVEKLKNGQERGEFVVIVEGRVACAKNARENMIN